MVLVSATHGGWILFSILSGRQIDRCYSQFSSWVSATFILSSRCLLKLRFLWSSFAPLNLLWWRTWVPCVWKTWQFYLPPLWFFFLILWSTKDDVTNIYVHTTLNVNILTFFFTSCVCLIFKRQLQVTFLLFLSSPLPVPSPEITTCMHLVFIPPVLVLILLLHIRVSKSKMQCCLKFIQTL